MPATRKKNCSVVSRSGRASEKEVSLEQVLKDFDALGCEETIGFEAAIMESLTNLIKLRSLQNSRTRVRPYQAKQNERPRHIMSVQ
jgi:hypothetical protein